MAFSPWVPNYHCQMNSSSATSATEKRSRISSKDPHSADLEKGVMGRALKELKTMIGSGELNPGEQLRQEEMAEKLQISRVPLREALNILADQGLLIHRPRQGYFVTKRASSEYAQIRRMCHLLENELLQSIRWPDDELLEELRDLNQQMRRCLNPFNRPELIALNQRFHFAVFGLSPNNLIFEEVRRLWSLSETQAWQKFERADERERTLQEHDRLIDALAARDRARCIKELELHRYSAESGLPLELPGAVPDIPAPVPSRNGPTA